MSAFEQLVTDYSLFLSKGKEVSDRVKAQTGESMTQLIILDYLSKLENGAKRGTVSKSTGLHWDVVTASLQVLSGKKWLEKVGDAFRITDAGRTALVQAKAKL